MTDAWDGAQGGDIPSSRADRDPSARHAFGADDAMSVLRELVRLKDEKDRFGETERYRANKDRAWDAARDILAGVGGARSPLAAFLSHWARETPSRR